MRRPHHVVALLAVCVTALLAGCGASGPKVSDPKLHDELVKAAESKGLAPDKSDAFATCVVQQLSSQGYANSQTSEVPSDKTKAAGAACGIQIALGSSSTDTSGASSSGSTDTSGASSSSSSTNTGGASSSSTSTP